MASKVNTKFVMFLLVAFGIAVMLVGGLYVLNVRGNAERAVRRGDEAYQRGDMRAARDFYGRAINKEPGNLQYLAKLEDATLKIEPKTAGEASELYQGWVAILRHAARHDPGNAQNHERLLQEIFSTARRSGSGWDMLEAPAEDMRRSLPESDPRRHHATVYKCNSLFRRSSLNTPEELMAAEAEMEQVVKNLSDNDLAWATLILGQMTIGEKMVRDWGRSGQPVDDQNAKIDATIQQAFQAVPNGPEVAWLQLRRHMIRQRQNPEAVSNDQIKQAMDHLIASLADHAEVGVVLESASLMAAVKSEGLKQSIELLDQYLQRYPDAHDMRLTMALECYHDNQAERSEKAVLEVLNSPQLPVCYLAQIQPMLRKRAAGLLVDLKTRNWTLAKTEDRPALAPTIEEARARLSELASDPANDPELMRADAWIAFTRGDYPRAAKLFDRLVRETALGQDAATVYNSAMALERIGQIGLAHERIGQALQLNPDHTPLTITKARLEFAMGRRQDAMNTLATLPKDAAESEEVRQLTKSIISTAENMAIPEGTDAVSVAMSKANGAVIKGDLETARGIVAAALVQAPDHLPLLKMMIAIESRLGQIDSAREYLARSLALDPKDVHLRRFETVLKYDDPIEALREMYKSEIPDEAERALAMLDSLRVMAVEEGAKAIRLNDPAASQKARTTSERAKAEAEIWAAEVERHSPDHPRLIDYQFEVALNDKNWDRVQQLVERARTLDLDQANGLLYKGRAELIRAVGLTEAGKPQEGRPLFQEAVRSLEGAVDRIRFSAPAWRTLAIAYQTLGNYAQAERAFDQAYKCNPTDLATIRGFLEVLGRRGDFARALALLRGAHELAPADPQIMHMWLVMENQAGDRALALNTRRALYKSHPDDLLNAQTLVRMFSSMQPTRETIIDSAGDPIYVDQRWSRLSAAERDQILRTVKLDWYKQSDAIVDRLFTQSGETIEVVALRAALLRERGEVTAGEKLLSDFIDKQGDKASAAMLIELGRYLDQTNRPREAIATLNHAVERQAPGEFGADLEIAQLYMRLAVFDKALKHLEKVLTIADERVQKQQAIECLVKLNRFDEAETRLKELMRVAGEDTVSLLLQANILDGRAVDLLAKGDRVAGERRHAEFREVLTRAQTKDPSSPTPRLVLAQFMIREFRRTKQASLLEEALQVLDEAEKVRADLMEISSLRIAVYNEKGDKSAVIGELRRFLDRNPDHLRARGDLAQAYVETGQADTALAVIGEGIKRNPTVSIWYDVQGDLYKAARGDSETALASYIKAYELTPTPLGLFKIADAALASKNRDCRGLVARLESRADDLASWPLLREAYARALACADRRPDAMTQLRQSYAARRDLIQDGKMQESEILNWFQTVSFLFASPQIPGQVDASAAEQFVLEICGSTMTAIERRGLAKLWVLSGESTLVRAIEVIQQAINQCKPDENQLKQSLLAEMAQYHLGTGKLKDAVDAYLEVLKIDPDNVEALNNVAYVTAEDLKDPSRAVQYADRALKLAPNSAPVLDTAGWVYYLAGDMDKAQKTLQESFRLSKTVVVCLHLVEAHLNGNDLISAQQYVDEGLRLNPDPESRKKLQDFAAQIQTKRGQ